MGDQGRTGSSANVGLLGSHGRSEDGFLADSKCELNVAGDWCCGHALIGLRACVLSRVCLDWLRACSVQSLLVFFALCAVMDCKQKFEELVTQVGLCDGVKKSQGLGLLYLNSHTSPEFTQKGGIYLVVRILRITSWGPFWGSLFWDAPYKNQNEPFQQDLGIGKLQNYKHLRSSTSYMLQLSAFVLRKNLETCLSWGSIH